MTSDELRDSRRSLQQWELDRRLNYRYQRPRPPIAGSSGGGGGGGGGVWAIDTIANDRIFQRSPGNLYTADIPITGTYQGTVATVQVRVYDIQYGFDVVSWQTLDATPSGQVFDGVVTVPCGGPYGVEVRDAASVSDGAVGLTQFFVGAIIIGYGQSNMGGLFSSNSTPVPPADSRTRHFDGTNWVSVPNANGIRTLLNALASTTGIPWGSINASVAGAGSQHFVEGQGGFTGLAAQLDQVGDAEFIIWRQGEGDADSATLTNPVVYAARLDEIHEDVANYVGRTKSQIPFITGSLSTYGGTQDGISDNEWVQVQIAHILAGDTYPDITYSHSIMDAVRVDTFHYDGTSQGKAGNRYAQSILVKLGSAPQNHPAWFIYDVSILDANTTLVSVIHSMGTDFSPASGITGFEVSNDNGAYFFQATGSRVSPTVISLTHPNMGVENDRIVRYQYGTFPDVSNPVLDNSFLQSPLNHSNHQTFTALGSGTLPVPTFHEARYTNTSGAVQATLFSPIGPFATDRLIMSLAIGSNHPTQLLSAEFQTDNGNFPAEVIYAPASTNVGPPGNPPRCVGAMQAVLPAGAYLSTILTTWSGSPNPYSQAVWSVPVSDLLSTYAVDRQHSYTTVNDFFINVPFRSDGSGFALVGALHWNFNTGNVTISGYETFAERADAGTGGKRIAYADASNTMDTYGVDTNMAQAIASGGSDVDGMSILVVTYR